MPWFSGFDEAIPLPRGRTLVTLKDAGNYITKLPKAEHEAPEWRCPEMREFSWSSSSRCTLAAWAILPSVRGS